LVRRLALRGSDSDNDDVFIYSCRNKKVAYMYRERGGEREKEREKESSFLLQRAISYGISSEISAQSRVDFQPKSRIVAFLLSHEQILLQKIVFSRQG